MIEIQRDILLTVDDNLVRLSIANGAEMALVCQGAAVSGADIACM